MASAVSGVQAVCEWSADARNMLMSLDLQPLKRNSLLPEVSDPDPSEVQGSAEFLGGIWWPFRVSVVRMMLPCCLRPKEAEVCGWASWRPPVKPGAWSVVS